MIVAGGTGGHIYPALAIAEYLRRKEIGIHWLGSRHGMEGRIIPKYGIALSEISVSALRGKRWWRWGLAPFVISIAIFQAILAMLRIRPSVVLGMGGFVSGPGGIAAWLCRVPLVIHEQNAIAGLTNRIVSHFAVRTLAGYPKSFNGDTGVIVTGNPVRESIVQIPPPTMREGVRGALRVLVVGGSLGAQRLNKIVPDALALLAREGRVEIWHQTGESDIDATQQRYRDNAVTARVVPFIVEIAEAYSWADIVVCRAGAITVAELAASGVASILIPFPHAVDDHQAANASYLTERGAAIMIRESELSVVGLGQLLDTLERDRARLLRMACCARESAMLNATVEVATHCMDLIHD